MIRGLGRSRQHQVHGFTLVELMVALSVIAILSAIAWPGYAGIVHRAQRNDARLALLRLQHLQERHYATHLRYAARLGTAADADTLVTSDRSDAGLYFLSLVVSEDGQRYIASAAANPDGRQRRDSECQKLSIDQAGTRRSADASGDWSGTDPLRCWK
jgi:type IV pilus assembly protein PilE